ncbi:amidohydrolase [Muricauda sp. ANG21]|uniref:amidohydrolase n=1 Tax=Allomuricauda sp. ANG21 TaxID=3042468 RepID=UPI003456073B
MRKLILLVSVCTLVFGCQKEQDQEKADTIYFGGDIVTMEGESPEYVEALAVKNGKILFVGPENEAMGFSSDSTHLVDIKNNTLIPGFYDPHSHVVFQSAKFGCVNLDPYPIGDIRTIPDIQRKLREHIDQKKPKTGTTIIGWGYDDTGLEEMRHPNRDDLDAVSTEHAIVLMHISSHLITCNSKALELAGISADTKDPNGGKIQRRPGSDEPLGVMEEQAMFLLMKILPIPTMDEAINLMKQGLLNYAAEGITTCQDGNTMPDAMKLLQVMEAQNKLPIDVISYPMYKFTTDSLLSEIAKDFNATDRLITKGIKLTVDGAIQGYTAYLSEPYFVQPEGSSEVEKAGCMNEFGGQLVTGETSHTETEKVAIKDFEGYRGYPSMTQEEIEGWIRKADEKGVQLIVHCNGDAAVDVLIGALNNVRGKTPRPDLRTTIIHSQTIRDEQMDYAAENGIILSFFPIHIEFWGDRHESLFLGKERAERINPANTALRKGAKITLHHDAPIAHCGMLPVISAAVNRLTSGGKLLGADERITPYQALCAVTRDAAYQSFEDDRKGTLTKGKLADLVILDENPLKGDPKKIKNIKVLETIKEGVSIYKNKE